MSLAFPRWQDGGHQRQCHPDRPGGGRGTGRGRRSGALLDIDPNGAAGAEVLGEAAFFLTVDLTDDAALALAIAAIRERFGAVAGLVNLACTYLDDGLESSRGDWLKALDVNLVSAVMLAKALHTDLKGAAGGGGQLHLHLRRLRPDRALAVSRLQGRTQAANPQHGAGSGAGRHSRQLGVAGWTWSR